MKMASHMVLLLLCLTSVQLVTAKLCPDNVTKCAEANTCCPMKDDISYGCCPQTNAVCCSDHVHCCPAGMTCDTEHMRCSVARSSSGGSIVRWILALMGRTDTPLMTLQTGKTVGQTQLEQGVAVPEQAVQAALQAALGNGTHRAMVPCPDSSVCPGDYTCCPFSSGNYGCCPYGQGVCCPDHLSCCPHATTCAAGGTCQRN